MIVARRQHLRGGLRATGFAASLFVASSALAEEGGSTETEPAEFENGTAGENGTAEENGDTTPNGADSSPTGASAGAAVVPLGDEEVSSAGAVTASPAEGASTEGGSPENTSTDDYADSTEPAPTEADDKSRRGFQFAVMVDLTIPFAKTADFISDPSLQGFSLEARYFLSEELAVGVAAGFDTLSKKSNDVVEWDEIVVTGINTRDLSFTPILAKVGYAPFDISEFVPYGALGIGAARVATQVLTGIYSLSDAYWHFAVVPEVGISARFGRATFISSLRLNYLPPAKGTTSHLLGNVSLGVAVQ